MNDKKRMVTKHVIQYSKRQENSKQRTGVAQRTDSRDGRKRNQRKGACEKEETAGV